MDLLLLQEMALIYYFLAAEAVEAELLELVRVLQMAARLRSLMLLVDLLDLLLPEISAEAAAELELLLAEMAAVTVH